MFNTVLYTEYKIVSYIKYVEIENSIQSAVVPVCRVAVVWNGVCNILSLTRIQSTLAKCFESVKPHFYQK